MNGNPRSTTSKVRRPRAHVQFGPPGAQPIVQPQPTVVQLQPTIVQAQKSAQPQPGAQPQPAQPISVRPKSVQPKRARQAQTPNMRIVQE